MADVTLDRPPLLAEAATAPSLAQLIEGGFTGKQECLELLRQMREIRAFEEKIYDLYRSGKIGGASHLSAGQEAAAVGGIAALGRQDFISSTHRGHGHCGAIGDLHALNETERQEHWNRMMAELMGKVTGYCKGRGGSMHIADVERGNLGATGIVAGNMPIATGAALAEKLKGTDSVVLCFFGEGATNTGTFHESLNMGAALLGGLPVVYLCENNLYGMSVPYYDRSVEFAGQASSVRDVAVRATAYGIPGETVDGMDVMAVKMAVQRAVDRARRGEGPSLIEAKCYRWYGHSFSDARAYRTREEEKAWRARCPIAGFEAKLRDAGVATEAEIKEIEAQTAEMIDKATQFAFDSPFPDASDVFQNIYAPEDREQWERDRQAEATLRAQIRPAEDAMWAQAREAAGPHDRALIPKLNKEQAGALQAQFGVPFLLYKDALVEAHREEMERDERVFLLGEDIGVYGSAYGATKGLLEQFGPRRVIDTAISEAAVAGAAAGAATRGLRPVAEIMYIDFATISADQIIHNLAYNRYMFGGKVSLPAVIRTEGGVGRSFAATHSESFEGLFLPIPGLYVVMPSTPYDAKGLLKASIRCDNPVIFIEHKVLYGSAIGPVPAEDYVIPLGVADVKKTGTDVTIVAYSRMLHFALDAAYELEQEGISAEVVDPRTLHPLDVKTLATSVRKTGRLLTVSEAYPRCGIGLEMGRQIMDYRFSDGWTGFDCLDAAPVFLSGKDCPIPMSPPLEDAVVPTKAEILEAAHRLCGR